MLNFTVINFSRFDKYRSLWIFILTHGCENDFLYAADAPFHISKIKFALTSNTNWIGIPKFLVVQACRGMETDEGILVCGDFCDGKGNEKCSVEAVDYNVPTTSDMIFFHSTWQGGVSFRNITGTPFIHYFAENMERHFYSDDIIKLFTKICQDVAYNFNAFTANTPKFSQLKQMPCFEHSFMYKLHFGRDLPESETSEKIEMERYKMDHKYRGLVLFFYQKDYSLQGMCDRSADGDIERLYPLFNDLGYKVVVEIDKTATEVREILDRTSKQDFSEHDSFIIIFSGHGVAGKLYLREGFLYTNEIWDSFTFLNVKTLVGKPKIFFISACRGGLHDEGSIGEFVLPEDTVECVNQSDVVISYEPPSKGPLTIPSKADILAVFSSATDYVSIVDIKQRGTFFLIELFNVLNNFQYEENMMDIIYRLNEKVAKRITKDLKAEKQMSFVLSSLTKELYFPIKKT